MKSFAADARDRARTERDRARNQLAKIRRVIIALIIALARDGGELGIQSDRDAVSRIARLVGVDEEKERTRGTARRKRRS